MRPLWKDAILTWIGVNITAFTLAVTLSPLISNWSWFAGLLAFNSAMVALLNWLVMPSLNWLAREWLDRLHRNKADDYRRTDTP